MPPSVVRLGICTQLPLMDGLIMASSGSNVASCPTVASVSLPRVTPLLALLEAGQGDRAERY